MQDWHAMFLGRRRLPHDLSAFELEAFFTFAGGERRAIEERRQPSLKLGLALQMGFLRMTGRPLEAVGAVPPALGSTWARSCRSQPLIWLRCE